MGVYQLFFWREEREGWMDEDRGIWRSGIGGGDAVKWAVVLIDRREHSYVVSDIRGRVDDSWNPSCIRYRWSWNSCYNWYISHWRGSRCYNWYISHWRGSSSCYHWYISPYWRNSSRCYRLYISHWRGSSSSWYWWYISHWRGSRCYNWYISHWRGSSSWYW